MGRSTGRQAGGYVTIEAETISGGPQLSQDFLGALLQLPFGPLVFTNTSGPLRIEEKWPWLQY